VLKRFIGTAAICLLGVAGCSSGSSSQTSGPSESSAAAIGSMLKAKTGGCTDYAKTDTTSIGQQAAGAGSCTVGGEDLKIYYFKDAGSKSNWMSLRSKLGCSMAKAFGFTQRAYIEGPNWVVDTQSETEAKDLASKTGAAQRLLKC
jgi:hypothetical protein